MLDSRHPLSRREALRLGGITISLGAIVAACGENRGGDTAPGRVGNAAPYEELEDYTVDDAVLLRTASSLELTAVEVYETALGLNALDIAVVTLVERFIANHRATADRMAELTVAAGGTAWTEPNPWLMDRVVGPVLATIATSDDVARDLVNTVIALESLAAATHQTLTIALSTSEQRLAVAEAAAQESRHAAAMVITTSGATNYFSPALANQDVPIVEGVPTPYAVPSRFGFVGQLELIIGAADENGGRTDYTLQTPSLNSFVYNEYS